MAMPCLTTGSSMLNCTTTMALPSATVLPLRQPFLVPSVVKFSSRYHSLKLNFVDFSSRTRVSAAAGEFADSSNCNDSVHTSDNHQLGTINMECKLVDSDDLSNQLKILKSVGVDGVMVDTWWGIVEANSPQQYNWKGNVGDDVHIPLPKWVREIGQGNPDIYFTDRDGRRNPESLTWGIDKERVLKGRTAIEVYFEYMRSFRVEFDEFFEDGSITEIEIGLGACGELRYPSYPAKHGSYNSQPQDTKFFCDGGDYDGAYGRFFLNWYSQSLIDHGDRVLALANLAFEGTPISVKLSGIHWWYKTASHAAELTAGFYNRTNRDGYAPIASMLKKHGTALNFTCVELRTLDQQEGFPEAMADPEGLVWQTSHENYDVVLNAAWDADIPVASENALPCYDRQGYNKILEHAKPRDDPDGRHLSAFTYLRLNQALLHEHNLREFQLFVKRMHGEAVEGL
ncbi:Glycoside hydrolase, catalytic domain-containing protein [Cynara cardunculus var. scolymus]|uniref:Beta-amylase n=1 Tax=Cynara cardunculus var. scolymus TaxID=59895 RepID=A0A118JT69_CYNCS|nr:Glycoside hydrolase, catalytic domain-containing protein [Cynara cardunculus var. scolymus]